jgi:hypothetical protein
MPMLAARRRASETWPIFSVAEAARNKARLLARIIHKAMEISTVCHCLQASSAGRKLAIQHCLLASSGTLYE